MSLYFIARLIKSIYNCGKRFPKYHKIPIITPGLIFVQKAFLLGLFSGELIFGGAYYWKEFCVTKWVGLGNKNSLKHYENGLKQLKTASTNSPWAYFREGLFLGGAYYRNFTEFVKEALL